MSFSFHAQNKTKKKEEVLLITIVKVEF